MPRPIAPFDAKDYAALQGMFIVETRDLAPLSPQRGLVLWMDKASKFEQAAGFADCHDSVAGSHYTGAAFLSLVQPGTHQIIQTLPLTSTDPDRTAIDVPFRFKKGRLYSVCGGPNGNQEYPTVLLDPIPLDQEPGVEEYALFQAQDGCFCPEVILFGYDSKTGNLFRSREVSYAPQDDGKAEGAVSDSFFDLFFEAARHPGLKTYDFASGIGHGSDITTYQRYRYDPATKCYYGVSSDLTDGQSKGFQDEKTGALTPKAVRYLDGLWKKYKPAPEPAKPLPVQTFQAPATALWQEWTEREGRFSVLFPQKPALFSVSPWTSQAGSNFYSIRYSPAPPGNGPVTAMDSAIQNEPHGTGWKILGKKFFKFGDFPAGEYQTEDADGLKVTRFILTHGRLYALSSQAVGKDFDTPAMEKYFGSLKLLHPELEAGNWLEFKSEAGRFSVLLPAIPQDSAGDKDWRVGDDEGCNYELEYNDDKGLSDQTFAKDVLGIATKLPGRLSDNKTFVYQGFPADQFAVEAPEGVNLVMRFVLVHYRLYILSCMGKNLDTHSEKTGKYFDSFKFNHPELNTAPAGEGTSH